MTKERVDWFKRYSESDDPDLVVTGMAEKIEQLTSLLKLATDAMNAEHSSNPAGRFTPGCPECEALREIESSGHEPKPSHVPGYRVFDEASDVPAAVWSEPSAQCGAKFPCEGETYTCTLKAGHGSGHGVIEIQADDSLGEQIYALLVRRGYAQHEAHLIAGGPGCISDCVQKGEPEYECPKHGARAQRPE